MEWWISTSLIVLVQFQPSNSTIKLVGIHYAIVVSNQIAHFK